MQRTVRAAARAALGRFRFSFVRCRGAARCGDPARFSILVGPE